jgi:hypothetical protein
MKDRLPFPAGGVQLVEELPVAEQVRILVRQRALRRYGGRQNLRISSSVLKVPMSREVIRTTSQSIFSSAATS